MEDRMKRPQVPAAHNVLRILTLLSTTDVPLSAARIQRDLGLPRSTTYHLLRELEDSGFVVHLRELGTYGLGLTAYSMAASYTTQQPLVRLVKKDLERIAVDTGGSCHLSRLSGTEVVYLLETRSPQAVSLVTDAGVRLPALCTASGRIMIAHLSAPEIRAVYSSAGLQREYRAARERLTESRRRGWEIEREEVSRGQASIAVALLDHLDRPAAALTVTVPLSTLTNPRDRELADNLTEVSRRISNKFFGEK